MGAKIRGRLRAPPRGLAELTATNVPGERVLVPKTGDWGRHVPLVDDLLASGVLRGGPTRVVGPAGTTLITPPATWEGRVRGWLKLSLSYQRYAEQRRRSLESDEAQVQRGFADTIWHETGIRLDFSPHPFARALPRPRELPGPDAAPGGSGEPHGLTVSAAGSSSRSRARRGSRPCRVTSCTTP